MTVEERNELIAVLREFVIRVSKNQSATDEELKAMTNTAALLLSVV